MQDVQQALDRALVPLEVITAGALHITYVGFAQYRAGGQRTIALFVDEVHERDRSDCVVAGSINK